MGYQFVHVIDLFPLSAAIKTEQHYRPDHKLDKRNGQINEKPPTQSNFSNRFCVFGR